MICDVGKTFIMLKQMFYLIHLATGQGFFYVQLPIGVVMETIGNLWLYVVFFGPVTVMFLSIFLGL